MRCCMFFLSCFDIFFWGCDTGEMRWRTAGVPHGARKASWSWSVASQALVSVASNRKPPTLWCPAAHLLHLLQVRHLLHPLQVLLAQAIMRSLLARAMRFKQKFRVLVAVSAPLTVTLALAHQMCQVELQLILCASCRIAALVTSTALWHASWEDVLPVPSVSICPACWVFAFILTPSLQWHWDLQTPRSPSELVWVCRPCSGSNRRRCESICFHSVAWVDWAGHRCFPRCSSNTVTQYCKTLKTAYTCKKLAGSTCRQMHVLFLIQWESGTKKTV